MAGTKGLTTGMAEAKGEREVSRHDVAGGLWWEFVFHSKFKGF